MSPFRQLTRKPNNSQKPISVRAKALGTRRVMHVS